MYSYSRKTTTRYEEILENNKHIKEYKKVGSPGRGSTRQSQSPIENASNLSYPKSKKGDTVSRMSLPSKIKGPSVEKKGVKENVYKTLMNPYYGYYYGYYHNQNPSYYN